MFVGHGLFAFALVAGLARWQGWDPQPALRIGLLAALFATLPDVDILYGPVGLLGGVSGVMQAAEAFWETGNVIHRGPTHSLVLGTLAAVGFGLAASDDARIRGLGTAFLASIVALVALVSGGLGGIVMVAFVVGGMVLVGAADRWELSPSAIAAGAVGGLCSHPLGDLLTGEPPAVLYPFDAVLFTERIALHPDPTLHLLSAFGVELATAWLALATYVWVTDGSVREYVDRRAGLGASYGAAAIALPAPTLETSYHFVFSVLALSGLGLTRRSLRRVDLARAAGTGLAAVTVAGFSYAVVYAVF